VLPLVACGVERDHRHGHAVLLSDQAGLAVDTTFQDRQVWSDVGIDEGSRDLLAAFDRAEPGGEAAAVADRCSAGWPRPEKRGQPL
jgi:hypothetical protein